jgi:hypothetical protein
MTYRMLAALVVLSGIGATIGTAGAGTAPGAFVGASSFHGGFHPSGAGFMGARHFVARTRGDFFFRGRERREERREGEFRRWPGLAGYVPYYYPVESPVSYDEPLYRYAYPDSPATAPNVFRPPLECSTDSQKVPSEKGGVATINVTRCY